MSPAVRKVLACNNLDGDTVAGRLVDSLAPDVVMAKFISGTASSIRVRSLLMSLTMSLISASLRERSLGDFAPFRSNSSEAAAFANRCPRACISNRSVFVSETADSKDVLPLAALRMIRKVSSLYSQLNQRAYINSIISMAGVITWSPNKPAVQKTERMT